MAVVWILILIVSLATLFSMSSSAVIDASEILSDAGYVSMSLTLLSVASDTKTLDLDHSPLSSLTVFAPSDASFSGAGQPPLSLLRYHFSRLSLSASTLRSLPAGAEIPTLSGRNLVVTTTTSDGEVSINGVAVSTAEPIFDDGSLVVYGVHSFFDPSFLRGGRRNQCESPPPDIRSWLREASESLRRSGYSSAASSLEAQLFLGFEIGDDQVTVFAPTDQALNDSASVFLRHAVPCRLPWSDLKNSSGVFPTFLEGFTITISRSGDDSVSLNGVSVSQPDIYVGDSIAVHGLSGILSLPESASSESNKDIQDSKNNEF